MRDVDGRVQKVRVDVSYVPELLEYLDTTPTRRVASPPVRRSVPTLPLPATDRSEA